jgi:hypothetical protein
MPGCAIPVWVQALAHVHINKGQIMKRKTFSTISAQQGVVLIEAMVAILLFSMGVLAVVGLQNTVPMPLILPRKK